MKPHAVTDYNHENCQLTSETNVEPKLKKIIHSGRILSRVIPWIQQRELSTF
jgi:hypothetical protein